MFPQLSSSLGSSEESKTVTVDELAPDKAGFVLHHFISRWLKNGHKVVIVGLEHSFGHYHSVGIKLGYNLLKLREKGQVVFYEGLKKILDSSLADSSTFQVDDTGLSSLKPLYLEISSLITDNTLVILDQVSILTCLGFTTPSIYAFCHYLMSMMASMDTCQLVMRLDQAGGRSVQLVRLLQQLSRLNLTVAGLQTGQSRDVSGVLTMQDRGAEGQKGGQRTFQFRVEDKNVKIFAPGTSSAVL
eukprot:TRINITY_DN25013_c0_g1_i1.p1 TRINITY_DN25013_c0_g1~~TRINITY_DN25013_c0_g1_i1.p1  ORF type:complete len:244 (-),score=84.27 TRINITY_DN25013_c0_g1_i1:67-798(-)